MSLHPLLESQIKALLPGGSGDASLSKFIEAVNASYFVHDKDKELLSTCETNQAEDALKQSEEKYRNIIEKSTDIIYKTNQAGIFTFVNPVAERITGFTQEELLDKHFSELIREDHRKMANSIYRRQVMFKKSTSYLEFPIVTKTGKERWIGQSVQYSAIGENDYELTALAIDITDRKAAEKTVLLKEAKYRNIIANINMGLVEVDTHEVIRYCNQGFCELSGYSMDELIGKNIVDALIFESSKDALKNKTAQRVNGVSDIYEIQIKNKKGEIRWWMVSGAPNYDDAGNLVGSIGIHLDVTERKLLEEELRISKRKAEESSKAKESFLANMSHEIRTPLNAIIGMIRELSYEDLTEKQRGYLQNTAAASQHLFSVLNNILDISKIEAGEFNLDAHNFNLSTVLNETVGMMQNKASEKNLYLNVSLADSLKKTFVGDAVRIKQILINLLGNSLKFTETGGVTIKCDLDKETSTEQTLKLSVIDTGIGMDASYLKKIFTKFSQEDISTSRKYGGTGLGMAIIHELIHLMKGSIEVSSEKNIGTTVEIKITLPFGDDSKTLVDSAPEDSFNRRKIKVLLAEDNKLNRLVATKTLNRYNCEVIEAVNGEEAVEKIKTEHFDVILMDLQMPVMDGMEATRIIRNELGLNIPIIALSANAFKNEIDNCLKLGMNDYVTKPFEEKQLIGSILKSTQIISDETKTDVKVTRTEKLYSMDKVMDICKGDTDFVKQLIELFINQSCTSMQQIKEAYEQGDMESVFQIAHKIKPGIETMGIHCLKEEILEIEDKAKSGQNSDNMEKLVYYTDNILKKVVYDLQREVF